MIQSTWRVQRAREVCSASVEEGGDHASSVHLADAAVPVVCDVEVSRCVEGEAEGGVELGLRGRASVSREAELPRSGDRGDDPVLVDPTNDSLVGLGDVEVASRV